MNTKYSYLTDMELIHLIRYTQGDLVEELCARLEKRVEENERLVREMGDDD